MYRPDRVMVKKLQEYGREYNARWDRDQERWVVTFRGKDALTVMNPDGSYRPLDDRTIARLEITDSWKHGKRAQLAAMDKHNHRIKHAARGPFRDRMHESGLDAHRAIKGGPLHRVGIDL